MPDIEKADTQSDKPAKANEYSLKAAIALYKSMPVGLRRITKGTAIAAGVLVAVTAVHPHLSKAVFLTGSLLDLFVIVAVIIQAYIYVGQWDVMRDQLDVIKTQSRTMRGTWQVIRRQAKTLEDQLETLKKQTELSASQIKIMAESQRAELGIKTIAGTYLLEGRRPQVTVLIHNGGATAARFVTGHCYIAVGRGDIYADVKWADAPPKTKGSGSILPAHMDRPITLIGNFVLTKAQVEAIMTDKETKVLLYAEIHYVDFLDEPQTFPFQMIYDKHSNSWEDYYGQPQANRN